MKESLMSYWKKPKLAKALLAAGLLVLLAGCVDKPQGKPQKPAAGKPVALTILGYNYTGRYIHTFSVNGQWGGNLYETSAGGTQVCCLSFNPASRLPFEVKVEWTFGREENEQGVVTRPQEHHSATVQVNGPLPKNLAKNFEVHFLPDGSVQAYVTHFSSDALFTPQGKRIPNPQFMPPGDAPLYKN